MERDRGNDRKIPLAIAGVIVSIVIFSNAGSSILTPLWVDALNDKTTNGSHCNEDTNTHKVDPYFMLLIVNIFCTVLFGLITIVTNLCCSSVIRHSRNYDKKEFVVVGFSDAMTAMLVLLSSSGCRTAPYLQSLASNFSIPITFFLRFIVLRKRPTCRKISCAILVIIAEFTAILTDIFPGLESQGAKREDGGAVGLAGILWPVCYFLAFVPSAVCNIVLERILKSRSPSRQRRYHDDEDGGGVHVAYALFWCYFFSLLCQMLLFGLDIIPGFGTTDNIADFGRLILFNFKCFFGFYEECRGFVNYVSSLCVVVIILNRIIQAYFVKHLEGANLLAMILTIPTPIAFLFYTLFDENPFKWHPHAYLSTYLSIISLCIMIPAIYIYVTGDPEVDYNKSEPLPPPYTEEEQRPLLGNRQDIDNVNSFHGAVNVATQAGNMVDSGVQTSPQDGPQRGAVPKQNGQNRNPYQRVESNTLNPRRTIPRRYTTANENQVGQNQNKLGNSTGNSLMNFRISSSWHAPEHDNTSHGRSNVLDNQSLIDIRPLTEDTFTMTAPDENQTRSARSNPFMTADSDSDDPERIWNGPDFNIYQPQNQQRNSGNQTNDLPATSPYAEIDPVDQSSVHYNGVRERNRAIGQGDMADDEDTCLLTSSTRSYPPSYSTLPQE